MLVFNVAAMIANGANDVPSIFVDGTEALQIAMQPLLLSRFVLNLREAYLPDQPGVPSFAIGSLHISSIHFTATIVGNLGAPLTHGDPVHRSLDGEDEDQEPAPITCDDPFAVGLTDLNTTSGGPHELLVFSNSEPASDGSPRAGSSFV